MENMNVTPEFVLAGDATWTVDNGSGKHYTFHTYRAKPNDAYPNPAWFIKVLTGPDTYTYMGKLCPHLNRCNITLTGRSKYAGDSRAVEVARWALRAIWQAARVGYKMPPGYSIRHDGRCGRCGAKLTNPKSLDTGLGPECAEKSGVPYGFDSQRPKRDLLDDIDSVGNTDIGTRTLNRGGTFGQARRELVGFFTKRY